MSAETLTFATLVGLPLAAAVGLGLFVRSLVGRSRAWPLWLVAVGVCSLLWAIAFSRVTP